MISPERLRRFGCFAAISDGTLDKVAMVSDAKNYATGEVVFKDGEPALRLYLVEDGEVDLAYLIGHDHLQTVDTLVAGEMLMWSALVEPYRATATAVARTDATLIAIDATSLRELARSDHDLGYQLLETVTKLLADRLTNARVQLVGAT